MSRNFRGIGAHAAGGLWLGLLVVVSTPLYVRAVGTEGYAVLSVWLLLQPLLALFDLGLGAGLLRDLADTSDSARARRGAVLKTMEAIYWPVAGALAMGLAVAASWIAASWLNLEVLAPSAVASALVWMGFALAAQYPGGMYNSALAGLQRHGQLTLLQAIGNALRFVGGVVVLLTTEDLSTFFAWQTVVAAVQTTATRAVVWRHLRDGAQPARAAFSELTRIWRFSSGMAVTMVAGLLLANADRLFISGVLPAEEFGNYALAFTATGLLQLGIQPFYRVYFPRFSELVAAQAPAELEREYFEGCRLMAAVLIPCAVLGALLPGEVLSVWLGSPSPDTVASFRWLAVGVASAGLVWLPAAFQQAHGWTRLHAGMIFGALVVGVGLLGWAVDRWGAAGATIVWLIHGVSGLTLGLFLMHRRLLRGRLIPWYVEVVLPPLGLSAVIGVMTRMAVPAAPNRLWLAVMLGAAGMAAVTLSGAFSLRSSARR